MVPKKISDHLWEDFTTACNHFFEARKTVNNGAHTEEHANLSKKKEIINKLKELSENAGEDIQNEVQKLIDEYNAVGHVPYKDKDKIYEAYHDVLDKLYKDLHISIAKRRLDIFKNNLQNVAKSGGEALDNERSRLMRRYEGLKQEINTYENNLGFLNVSSKKGNTLIEEMNRKVEKLKDDLKLVKEKIKAIDAKNKENE
jgi:chromosome segregation ATPase